jgi:hypothetical protein
MVGWVRRERSQAVNEPAMRIAMPAAGKTRPATLADGGATSCCSFFE